MQASSRELLSRGLGAVYCAIGAALLLWMAWAIYDSRQWGYLGAGFLGLTLLGTGWSRLFPNAYDPIQIDNANPIMRSAIERSRRELHRFKSGLDDNRKQPFVKFPLTSPTGETEHIWGIVHSLKGQDLIVSLANDPVENQGELNPRQTVRLNEIEDWILISSSGETEGGYSMGAMAQIYRQEKGWVPAALKKELSNFKDLNIESLLE